MQFVPLLPTAPDVRSVALRAMKGGRGFIIVSSTFSFSLRQNVCLKPVPAVSAAKAHFLRHIQFLL